MLTETNNAKVEEVGWFSKILDSFLLRNLLLWLIMLSWTVAKKITQTFEFPLLGFLNVLCTFTLLYLIFIFHNRVLYTMLLKRGKYISYLLVLILILAVYDEVVLPYTRGIFRIQPVIIEPLGISILELYTRAIDIWVSLGVYLAFVYFKQREHQLKLESLSKEIELKQLKEHLNPHFLFNALNNIYSYTLENNAKSSELLLKLSELMRYITQNGQKDFVTLQDEIAFAEHYIAFERERLGDRCTVNIAVDVQDNDRKIAPFILFVFIENAFKHGTASTSSSEVYISISANKETTTLSITNAVKNSQVISTHTGLANIRRKLDLLYPQRYILLLNESAGSYMTRLTLQHA